MSEVKRQNAQVAGRGDRLGEAADVIARSPGALQLRQLQTMAEISAENNSTIIFPIPIELLEVFQAVGRATPPPAG